MNSNQKYPKAKAQAKAIDHKKDNILYAGATLIIGLAVMALFGARAHAQTDLPKNEESSDWSAHSQVSGDVKLPFELKSQKLSH